MYIYSRKLLVHTHLSERWATMTTTPTPSPSSQSSGHNNFDANIIMVLSVLVCAVICSLALNSIIRSVLRCTMVVGSETSAKLASGIKKRVLKTFPTFNYWHGLQLPGLDKECVICLCDFSKGERVKILPKCNHGFHVHCIDKWLRSHSTCPTCRNSLSDICQKILTSRNCNSAGSSQREEQGSSNTSIVSIVPLQHEGLLRNY
ncbi:hypothetical protein SSX86_011379 [Deinandra increscens subsp. villosa]|uniref:RING-type E3 ubiquitin transferase n=1 Tax=Deinandra increscens subsp. villosa TaxID=3103831 RepID=A0AAP0D6E1_9ASTR